MGDLIPIHELTVSRTPRIGLAAYVERDGSRPLRCTLVDISILGASVWAPEMALPKLFVLRLGGGMRRACEVVWRKGNTVGARFVPLGRMLLPPKMPGEMEELRYRSAFLRRATEELLGSRHSDPKSSKAVEKGPAA